LVFLPLLLAAIISAALFFSSSTGASLSGKTGGFPKNGRSYFKGTLMTFTSDMSKYSQET